MPDILIIDLKRFTNHVRKNSILVDFPLVNLDLKNYVIGYEKDSCVYDLYGICNHTGNVRGGHYTAFVKNIDQWYHFNDTNVTKITNIKKIKTNEAYCFFYRKKKSNE